MSDLIVIGYPDAESAEKARDDIFGLSPDDLLPFSQLSEAVVATRDEKGKIKLSHLIHLWPLKTGAASLWGLLIGARFLHPLFGLISAAAAGLIAGILTDCGIDEEFIKGVNDVLQPGRAALLLRHEDASPGELNEQIIEKLIGSGGQVLRANLDPAADRKLRRAIEHALNHTS